MAFRYRALSEKAPRLVFEEVYRMNSFGRIPFSFWNNYLFQEFVLQVCLPACSHLLQCPVHGLEVPSMSKATDQSSFSEGLAVVLSPLLLKGFVRSDVHFEVRKYVLK